MEQLKIFLKKAETDKELTEKLDILRSKGAGVDQYILLAAESGFTITAEELEMATKHNEVSEDELEEVAGGADMHGDVCHFTPAGETKYIHGDWRAKCASYCGAGNWLCSCYGWPSTCRECWHIIYREGAHRNYLRSYDLSNHNKKHPPSYNT